MGRTLSLLVARVFRAAWALLACDGALCARADGRGERSGGAGQLGGMGGSSGGLGGMLGGSGGGLGGLLGGGGTGGLTNMNGLSGILSGGMGGQSPSVSINQQSPIKSMAVLNNQSPLTSKPRKDLTQMLLNNLMSKHGGMNG